MIDKGEIKMNYMFSDKYAIRDYLDKEVGIDISDEIFAVITKDEEEYKKGKNVCCTMVDNVPYYYEKRALLQEGIWDNDIKNRY